MERAESPAHRRSEWGEALLAPASVLLLYPAWRLVSAGHDMGPVPGNYFFSLGAYFWTIGAAAAVSLAARWVKKAQLIVPLSAPVLLWGWGYLLADLAFQALGQKLRVGSLPLLPAETAQYLNIYLVGKLYQLIPLALLAAFLFRGSYLRAGDMAAVTDVLGGRKPLPWRRVVARFVLYLSVIFAVAVVMSLQGHASSGKLSLLVPIALYAMANCLIEEAMFRGLLLPRFAAALGSSRGNLLQALVFGLVHWPSFDIWHYLAKVVVFTFLGWLFGRAAKETGGLLASWLMHAAIVTAVELKALL